MDRKWILPERDKEAERALADALGVPPPIAGLLIRRNISGAEEAEIFFDPEGRQEFYDPFLLDGMGDAVLRIREAISCGEKIVVYGDYDVDGVTATAILLRELWRLGADAGYYIPSRAEGYGLNSDALSRIADGGARLVVTVDCGVSDIAEVEGARGKLDIVVTDHHLPGDALPRAVAVIDPHRRGSTYPFADLSGAGVAFKLCQALERELRGADADQDIELAALGTVADIVPLLSENRKIVKTGLRRMKDTPVVGLRALIEASGLSGKDITSRQVGFTIAPRLNAAGRLASASIGERLLLSEDEVEAASIAEELSRLNAERQAVEAAILEEAEAKLAAEDTRSARVLVVSGEGWDFGVIGIVASRLVDRYYRPTVVIGLSGGTGRGSCRSIRGMHMFDALTSCRDLLAQFGGHEMAAGLVIDEWHIGEFRERMEVFASAHLKDEDYIPTLNVDAELSPSELNLSLIDRLAMFEPCGMSNPSPLFICRGVRGRDAKAVGRDGKHLAFRTSDEAGAPRAIGWGMGALLDIVGAGPVDMAYMPEIDEWNGGRYIQCKLKDIRPASGPKVFPDRDALGNIYRTLRALRQMGRIPADEGVLAKAAGISPYTMRMGLIVLGELGLIQKDKDCYVLPPPPRQKLDLMDSDTYRDGIGNAIDESE